MSFVTPTRLKSDGKLSPHLGFHILIWNLLRRISLLSCFHCGEELDLDFKGLIEKSKSVEVKEGKLSWIDWKRYSNRQEARVKMGGFMGSVTFEGEMEPFLPFLLLGEEIHVGKGTSFGLGKYKILNLEFGFLIADSLDGDTIKNNKGVNDEESHSEYLLSPMFLMTSPESNFFFDEEGTAGLIFDQAGER